jgi:hypothetical protein
MKAFRPKSATLSPRLPWPVCQVRGGLLVSPMQDVMSKLRMPTVRLMCSSSAHQFEVYCSSYVPVYKQPRAPHLQAILLLHANLLAALLDHVAQYERHWPTLYQRQVVVGSFICSISDEELNGLMQVTIRLHCRTYLGLYSSCGLALEAGLSDWQARTTLRMCNTLLAFQQTEKRIRLHRVPVKVNSPPRLCLPRTCQSALPSPTVQSGLKQMHS